MKSMKLGKKTSKYKHDLIGEPFKYYSNPDKIKAT